KPEKIYWKQDYKNNRELTLSWDSKVNESIYFKDLRSITLNKIKDKNLSNFFIIQKGIPKVSPIKEEDFKRFISRFPTYRMKASGICFTATPKEKIKEFPIKKSPRGDEEEIGSIIINYSRLNNSVKTLLKTGDKTKEINISFFETNCRGEGHVSTSYPIKEVNGKYVNLGRGPWGEEGWVELKYKPIEKWGASFELGELRSVGFTKNGDGKYLVTGINMERSETEINEVGDESPEVNTSFTIEEERLWRNDNEFIPYYDCSYGC